ncbi:MAG: hypothetical protein IJ759_05230 [Bacteroidales bacterium]|nr:hypothetical protein [Bacteroidales bacterium]
MRRKNLNKTLLVLAVAGVLCFSSCSSKKKAMQEQTKKSFGVELELPCVNESYDDADYFKAMGTANNVNAQNARTAAFDAAKSMLLRRLGGFVSGLSADYSRSVSGDAKQDKVQRMIEGEMNTLVQKEINDAEKTCEKILQDEAGNYNSFVAIRVSKKELINKISDKLSNNEELEIEFNRDQFRKYAEDKMKKMQEQQKR